MPSCLFCREDVEGVLVPVLRCAKGELVGREGLQWKSVEEALYGLGGCEPLTSALGGWELCGRRRRLMLGSGGFIFRHCYRKSMFGKLLPDDVMGENLQPYSLSCRPVILP